MSIADPSAAPAEQAGGPRIGSLFSGYGGLDLAVELFTGGRTVWHAEIEPAAKALLAARWPGVPNLGDLTRVDWSSVEPVDVLTGGFPCQDVSTAGLRQGMRAGTRSGLWSYMAAAVDALRPEMVVVENVRGLLSADADGSLERDCWCVGDGGGTVLRALGAVLGDLADLGYDATWGTVPASWAGAPHRRERVFIVARPSDDPGLGERGEAEPRLRAESRPGPAGAVGRLPGGGLMLPTPAASESGSTPEQHLARKPGRTRVTDLSVVAGHLLPTPTASESTGASGAGRRDGGPSLRDVPKLLAVDVYDDELLPTPNARDFKDEALPPSLWNGEGPDKVARAVASLLPPPDGRPLFPTPTATDARDGKYLRSTTREAAARGSARGVALNHLVEGPMPEGGRPLLPTPVVRDMGAGRTAEQWDGWVGKMRDRFGGAGHGRSLEQEALRVLSTPTTGGNERSERFRGDGESRAHNPAELAADEAAAAELAAGFGPYAAAVARWEEAMGRPAPAPSAPGANGRMRLSPRFVEWMMGLPDGWVTGPDLGLSRAAQLKMLGNGVVPQQALLALRMIAAVRFTARVPR